ncbi:MAG: hypothetical protein ACPGLV_12040 [Bacteroidia bacterium]
MRILLLYIFTIFLPIYGLANKAELDKETWQKLIEDIEYKKKDKVEESEPEKTTENETDEDTGSGFSLGNVQHLFMVIVLIILLVLIGFMIANSRSNPSLKRQNIEIDKLDKIEEHIHDVNLDQLVNQFKSDNDFAMALRMSFLTIIKALSNKAFIKWEKQKTNWEYHSELSNYEMKRDFGQMIVIFENIWYGEKKITEQEFTLYQQQFESFKSTYVELEKAA